MSSTAIQEIFWKNIARASRRLPPPMFCGSPTKYFTRKI